MSADPNAAIYYVPEAFDTTRDRLVGRRAAGEGFLQAFVRYGDVDRVYAYCRTRKDFNAFNTHIADFLPPNRPTDWIPLERIDRLDHPGCLFLGSPGIADLAWHRRHLRSRAYSICGLTHTTASHAVMDAIGSLHIAPLQPWDAIICTSNAVRKTFEHVLENWRGYLENRLGAHCIMPVQLPVIPLGVECSHFEPGARADEARQGFRQQHAITDEDVAVLFMGRLSFHAKANPLPMYMALEQAARTVKSRVHLIQAGWFANEPIERAFRDGARTFCPSVNAIFVDGRVPEVRAKIRFAADVFTSLSDNIQETFGLTPIEAMAAGLPLVVSDWDGYRDTVRHGVDGFAIPTVMSPPGSGSGLALRYALGADTYDHYIGHVSQFTGVDVAACAAAYHQLLSDKDLRKTMGEAGRARARQAFDWPVIIAAYQDLWRELAERRRKDDELAPRRKGEVAHPLCEDPFSLFGNYPTISLQDEVVMSLRSEGVGPDLSAFRADPLTSVSRRFLAADEDSAKLLAHLRKQGKATVGELVKLVSDKRNRAPVRRTLAWLVKVGFLSIAQVDRGRTPSEIEN